MSDKLIGRLSGEQRLIGKLSVGVIEKSAVLISKQITENGTYLARNDSADGYSSVSVAIPIPPEPTLITKTITENGSYSAENDNADGYSSVIVAVQPDFLIEPYIRDLTGGWVNSDSSTNTSAIWTVQSGTSNLSDLYRVEADAHYIISLDGSPGNRFRPMFTEVDVSQATSNVTGVKIIGNYSSSQLSNPTAYYHLTYTAPSDGYITIQKSNAGQTGVKTYLFKIP